MRLGHRAPREARDERVDAGTGRRRIRDGPAGRVALKSVATRRSTRLRMSHDRTALDGRELLAARLSRIDRILDDPRGGLTAAETDAMATLIVRGATRGHAEEGRLVSGPARKEPRVGRAPVPAHT